MILIDKRLYEDIQDDLLTYCQACKLPVRKGREKEYHWQRCRYIKKDYGAVVGLDEDIAFFCPRCINEFLDKEDPETKRNLKSQGKKSPGRPKGTGNGGADRNKEDMRTRRKKDDK